MIYILSKSGKPLMPTKRAGHIKRLLKKGRARVACRKPFTVQLLYDTPERTQPLYGGTDPGRTNIGEGVVDTTGRCVYLAHVTTHNKEVPKLMAERKVHRQTSRRGERLRRKRRAKANNTTKEFPDGRVLPGCETPVPVKDISNTEARFMNRARPDGWITPTARQLVQTHVSAVKRVLKILPVTDWT